MAATDKTRKRSLPSNIFPNNLAKVGATQDPSIVSLFLSPLTSSQRLSIYTSSRRGIQLLPTPNPSTIFSEA